MFDGLESMFTTLQISLRVQNIFPPRFNPLVYNVQDVPEAVPDRDLPLLIETVSTRGTYRYPFKP